jgi:hypothetical protein
MTNEELRSLLVQLTRHLGAPTVPGIDLDLAQEFAVDLNVLYPNGLGLASDDLI